MIIKISEVKIIWIVLSDVYSRLHMTICNPEIKIIYIYFFCGAAAKRGPWPPHS
jgi:hypothetical protein